jgi:hypothetical protein
VDRSASAALIEVQAGKETERIDFRLTARPTVTLQGRVLLPQGVTPSREVRVTVLEQDSAAGVNMSTSASAPNFMFRLDNFAAGSYLLVAQTFAEGRQYRGLQRVELGSNSAEVTIPLEPGIDLAGSFTVEGPDAAQYPGAYVTLTPGDGIPWQGEPLRATVNKDGTFRVANVPPGVWDIGPGPIPPGGYLKAMRLGDQDVLTEEMVITSGTSAPLRIVVSTRAAAVEGSVTTSGRAVVLLAPEGRFGAVTSFYRLTASDEKGHFEIKGATPGTYKLYAFENLNANAIEDPDFLKPLESFGVPVELREGQSTSQDLTLIPASARRKP